MAVPLCVSPAYAMIAVAPMPFHEHTSVGDHPLTADSRCYVVEPGRNGLRVMRVRHRREYDMESLHLWSQRPAAWKVLVMRSNRVTTGICITELYDRENPAEKSLVFRVGLLFTADVWAVCRLKKWRFRNSGICFDRP